MNCRQQGTCTVNYVSIHCYENNQRCRECAFANESGDEVGYGYIIDSSDVDMNIVGASGGNDVIFAGVTQYSSVSSVDSVLNTSEIGL